MTLIETLFYKSDEETNQKRISKTKIISSIVFILIFVYSMTIPSPTDTGIFILLTTSIIMGLIFAIPTFIVGWLIGKLLNRNKSKLSENINPVTTQSSINTDNAEHVAPADDSDEYAEKFKKAVEMDDVDLASTILSKWDENDANYKYATIIFEGMPPSELGLTQLEEMLSSADTMKAYDASLKDWFRSTAVEVINLNK